MNFRRLKSLIVARQPQRLMPAIGSATRPRYSRTRSQALWWGRDVAEVDPELGPAVRFFAVIVFLVVLSGSLLLAAPGTLTPWWPWPIAPFGARFLGAVYLAEAVAVATLIVQNRWSPGRVVLVMAAAFTGMVSVASIIHVGELRWPGKRAILWFALYEGYFVLSLLALWRYRNLPPAAPLALSGSRKAIVMLTGSAFAAYAAAMFIAPQWAASFWPWPIDAMHGRIYSGLFLSAGIGLITVARGAAREEIRAVGLAATTLGVATVAGLFLAINATGKTGVLTPGAAVWIALLLAYSLLGAELVRVSRSSVSRSGTGELIPRST